ncbi:DUF4082 domain-containing protein [Bacillus thuringiensis]|uniref:DUF4082 domain-containing protein n=1 Tax=Bacillus thuringiensis TaxID=1428 RepID=UPI000BF3F353|nr:DUF4082 domain-containing protein [Bacillus thuringiensis]PFS77174.1 hypothetical protein COK50_08150 [Bacillus thuringiensis]
MPYLWSNANTEYEFKDNSHRGSPFQVKKNFFISELLLKTTQAEGWKTGEIWEINISEGKFLSRLHKGAALSRSGECYVSLPSPIELQANKTYIIIFGPALDVTRAAYSEKGIPTSTELFEAILNYTGSTTDNYGRVQEPAIGADARGNYYEIQVGFTIAKPEKYFEMCATPTVNWSSRKHTVANQITLNQNVKVVAMEFYTHPSLSSSTDSGTAKIWNANDSLIAKGNPSPPSVKGNWTRSVFPSPVALEKGNTYYIGFSAIGIGCAENIGARTILSSDGSLTMTVANENYSTSRPEDLDTRPEKKYAWQFSIRMYVEVDGTRFLIDSGGTIKKLSSSWLDVGDAPVTEQMFKDNGMSSLSGITAEQWRALPKNSKILVYSEEDKVFKASISRSNLYNSEEKLYRGTGIIETEMEELPAYRKTLMITADHQDCTFQYSLDNAVTWNAFQPGDIIDISKKSGKQLKIQINLPTDLATLTAISYAWS